MDGEGAEQEERNERERIREKTGFLMSCATRESDEIRIRSVEWISVLRGSRSCATLDSRHWTRSLKQLLSLS